MLIEFRVGNYKSIREPQLLSMVASQIKELPGNTCSCDSDHDLTLLRAAVIYGANAAGKSNLIKALSFMKDYVLISGALNIGDEIQVTPFLFDSDYADKVSQFEVTFTKNNVRFQYGFALDKHRVHEEWLNAYPAGRIQRWFYRAYDAIKNDYSWKFSSFFTGEKSSWKKQTIPNALFLSRATQLYSELLRPVFEWFQNDVLILGQSRESLQHTDELLESDTGKEKLLSYINIADSGVSDFIRLNREIAKSEFVHPNGVSLHLNQQSMGTQKLFWYAGYWEKVLQQGKVLLVDELDSSLHPLLVRALIEKIQNKKNEKNAQLIMATHDTSLLDPYLFRYDQIWFVEKDEHHSTQLYSLIDFSPRKDEKIGRRYLQGRYGALPFLSDWSF